MIAAQRGHHRAAPVPGRHDGSAHRIPYIHKRQGTRCVCTDAFDQRPFWPQGRKVITDAAALLHGQRGFAQIVEYRAHVVFDGVHDEAIEQRHATAGARTGDDAARRQHLEVR